ncbi:MAG TPA: BadF/BadG/BcrA/BcrD ATPase family protein [Pyrinomonadaceae bacterium]|jgi:N-acetylglucosamine kinase-like BadF-type ATPase|nr:BadF/BadG/BcrA/BcrD ATPase family protein [Pyrinomonadaceae bacterium]
MTTTIQPVDILPRRLAPLRRLVVGVDGGGTRTRAAVLNGAQILGEGAAGPSNPLRVGIDKGATAIREAVDKACAAALIQRDDLIAAGVGLAGIRRKDVRARMHDTLVQTLGIKNIELVSDGDIALYGATDGRPGVVVISGTGSIAVGMNRQGKRAYAGGWGPVAGDEGSGSWIARRALQSVARATDGRGPKTALTEAACEFFQVTTPDDLSTAIYAPTITNDRIAGFSKLVIQVAQDDDVAREILKDAGKELGKAAVTVIHKLKLDHERFQVAFIGGVFAAGELVTQPLTEEVMKHATKAFIDNPSFSPTVAAGRMAQENLQRLPVAV